MKPLAAPYDAEQLALEILTPRLANRGETCQARTDVPTGWTPSDEDAVAQVALDGTPTVQAPVLWVAVLRVTIHAKSRTESKRLAVLCQALLVAYEGDYRVGAITPGIGPNVATDPVNNAELAFITVQPHLRGLPL